MLNFFEGRAAFPARRAFLRFVSLSVLPAVILISAGFVSAQRTSGQLTGTVTDPNGAAVVGATVTVTQTGTNAQREATTNEDGIFTITDLPIGVYRVSVKGTGFKESVPPNVTETVASGTGEEAR